MKKKNQNAVAEATPVQSEVNSVGRSKRFILKEKCKILKPLVESGMYSSINEALIDSYKQGEHTDFRSFDEWKSEGYFVKKGSEAFVIWGKPVKATDENDNDYFPIAFVFSNAQVERKNKKADA
jgi:hypothetical protein